MNTIKIETEQVTWSNVDVSPDGKHILFDSLGDIYIMPISGGKAKAVTQEIAWNFQGKFSPDGKKIAFISDRDGAENLWVMNVDGSDMQQISKEKESLVHNPSWSPDGDYIVAKKGYMGNRSIPAGEIWLFHKSGGKGYQIKKKAGVQAQKNISEPTFSPDGRYIYFAMDNTPGLRWDYNKNPNGEVFVTKRYDTVTGEEETYIGGAGGAIRPTPSPDGKQMAFVTRKDDKTWLAVKDLKTGLETPLFGDMDRDLQETNGSTGNTPAIAWTPDNRSIVFWANGGIHRINVDSKKVTTIPLKIETEKKIVDAVRFEVDVAPDEFSIKMARWAQYSPDGKQIVFQTLGKLYVHDVKSGKSKRLTRSKNEFEFYPSYSRDGKTITFVSWNDNKLGHVKRVSARGGSASNVTKTPGHYVEPSFSPDGKKIVYRKFTGGYLLSPKYSMESGIFIIDKNGRNKPKLLSKSGVLPHFGKESDRVYFSAFDAGPSLTLKSIGTHGFEERTHLNGSAVHEFKVSPDGKWVAFTENYNAYVAAFTHTGKKESISGSTKTFPVAQVSKHAGTHLQWSKKSDALGWSHGANVYQRDLKDAFSFVDGAPEKLPEASPEPVNVSFKTKADKPKGIKVLKGARVVTMRDADNQKEVIENAVVIIENNRIKAVGSADSVEIPSGAKVIDMSGKTIIPGLVDVHAHGSQGREQITPQQNWANYSSIAFGVTTIHDPSNDTAEVFSASEMQRKGLIVGPRIYSTGTILYGANHPTYKAIINNYDDAEFHIKRLKEVGAISVKSYNQPRRDVRQQVIEAGRQHGIMVMPEGGAKFQYNMTMITDGHTGIEHAIPLQTGYSDVTQFWSQSKTEYTPTFVVAYGGLSGETYWYDRTNVWENERLMRYTPRYLVEPTAIRRSTAPDDHYNHIDVAKYAKVLRDKGVRVNIGAHGQREGLAAHWEMWMMEQGGFSAWEAIRGASFDGAKYIGMDKDIGSIEAGKLADLVVIDGNPLEDLKRSEYVTHTMINGRLYDAKTMNEVGGKKRAPFFFEQYPINSLPATTQKAIDAKAERHHWKH
jgi:Tol biopolymer transport system component/imidazolonepropionase-like amidohydrolase